MKTTQLLITLAILTLSPILARAGVFDLNSHLDRGKWSVGLEPELTLSQGNGAAFNFKPTYGVNDLLNWQPSIGTGSGARRFRVGLTANLEWFPDIESQPGIATPIFFEYVNLRNSEAQFYFGTKPLLYKTFRTANADYIPFLAVPLGWTMIGSTAYEFIQVALGCSFKLANNENWKFTAEAGFDAKNTYSYLSGGFTYYPIQR